MPPSVPRISTQAVLRPIWPALMAATYPPGPPPTTTTSYCSMAAEVEEKKAALLVVVAAARWRRLVPKAREALDNMIELACSVSVYYCVRYGTSEGLRPANEFRTKRRTLDLFTFSIIFAWKILHIYLVALY